MLRIAKRQMGVFQKYAVTQFEDRMATHLNKFFPDICKTLGDGPLREAIQYGMRRAKFYHISSERDVCKYIDLMFAYGPDFDKDPALPWAAGILKDDTISDPTEKIERLYEHALKETQEQT